MALRIKELLYDEMFTIAGAKKKLQSELRDTPKLKIVHPEPSTTEHSRPPRDIEPSLFDDEELELDDLADDISEQTDVPSTLDSNQRHALGLLATQLLELREILKTSRDRTP